MQNSFIIVTVSDNFREYFSDGKLLISCDGRNSVELSPLTNPSPVFLRPGVLDLTWKGVRQGGNVNFVVKAGVDFKPKTGYTINLDVDASSNQLVVLYDNKVHYVPLELVATDRPMIDMPFVESSDFSSGVQFSFSKSAPLQNVKALIVADGGIKDCTLTLSSATAEELGCDDQVSLVSSTVQTLLGLKGFVTKGLDSRREKMAYIDFAGMLQNMNVGSYSFTIVVTDKYSRTSSPVVLKVSVTD